MTEKTTPELPFTLAEAFPESTKETARLEVRHIDDAPESLLPPRIQIHRVHSGWNGEMQQYLGSYPAAELMRNLAALVPEVEPVAWLTESNIYRRGDRYGGALVESAEFLDKAAMIHGPLTPLYAHPPVTAEHAPVPEAANAREVIEDILRNDPENPGAPRLFPISAQDVLKALDARGLTVVDARNVVTAEPATAPSVDLVEGLNVEEWADKAERLAGLYHSLQDVVRNAGEALKEHGFTSDTLESQTLAESIHALAGRGAPSVDQIMKLVQFPGIGTTAREVAEKIHTLYGAGDASESISEGDYNAMHERAKRAERSAEDAKRGRDKAEARVERLEEERTACGYADLRAEVERYKAALEAAEKHIRALSLRFEAEKGQWAAETNVFHRTRDAAKTYQAWDAARVAVEAETSEEADRG